MIQWFYKSDRSPIITIHKSTLTINKTGSDMIKDMYCCMLGIDEDRQSVIMKFYSKDDYDSGKFDLDQLFVLQGGVTYSRISSAEFVTAIAQRFELDLKTKPRKFIGSYLKEEKELSIDLRKEIL